MSACKVRVQGRRCDLGLDKATRKGASEGGRGVGERPRVHAHPADVRFRRPSPEHRLKAPRVARARREPQRRHARAVLQRQPRPGLGQHRAQARVAAQRRQVERRLARPTGRVEERLALGGAAEPFGEAHDEGHAVRVAVLDGQEERGEVVLQRRGEGKQKWCNASQPRAVCCWSHESGASQDKVIERSNAAEGRCDYLRTLPFSVICSAELMSSRSASALPAAAARWHGEFSSCVGRGVAGARRGLETRSAHQLAGGGGSLSCRVRLGQERSLLFVPARARMGTPYADGSAPRRCSGPAVRWCCAEAR